MTAAAMQILECVVGQRGLSAGVKAPDVLGMAVRVKPMVRAGLGGENRDERRVGRLPFTADVTSIRIGLRLEQRGAVPQVGTTDFIGGLTFCRFWRVLR